MPRLRARFRQLQRRRRAGGIPDLHRRDDHVVGALVARRRVLRRRGGSTWSGCRSPPALTIGGLRALQGLLLAQEYQASRARRADRRMIRRVADHPDDHRRRRGRADDRARHLAAAAREVEGRPARAICAGRASCRRSPFRPCRCSERPAAAVPSRDRRLPAHRRPARDRPARTAPGEPGYVQIVDCATGAEGPGMSVEVGWSKNPNAKVNWAGGPVSGMIAPDRRHRMRLVAGERAARARAERVPP